MSKLMCVQFCETQGKKFARINLTDGFFDVDLDSATVLGDTLLRGVIEFEESGARLVRYDFKV